MKRERTAYTGIVAVMCCGSVLGQCVAAVCCSSVLWQCVATVCCRSVLQHCVAAVCCIRGFIKFQAVKRKTTAYSGIVEAVCCSRMLQKYIAAVCCSSTLQQCVAVQILLSGRLWSGNRQHTQVLL